MSGEFEDLAIKTFQNNKIHRERRMREKKKTALINVGQLKAA